MVTALDSGPRGLEFDYRRVRYQVTLWASCLHGYGSIRNTGHLQATLSKLLTYCVRKSTQPPTLSGTGNE